MGHTAEGWWVESGTETFFLGKGRLATQKDFEDYLKDMRSRYYKAFPEHQFDIIFETYTDNEYQPILDKLNAHPHL